MKKTNFFEGWYFKEQCKELTIAFIPEVSYDEKGNLIIGVIVYYYMNVKCVS